VASTERPHDGVDQATVGTTRAAAKRDPAAGASSLSASGDSAYLVPDWVRVRQEDFGLLFYDTRSTRLTFVRSGGSLVPPPFVGLHRVLGVRAREKAGAAGREGAEEAGAGREAPEHGAAGRGAPRNPADSALDRLLDDLVAKGLLITSQAV
jgi:putative mycofactocin binding protein MftB